MCEKPITSCKSKLQQDITSYQPEWLASKSPQKNKCWRGCGEEGNFPHCCWECKLVQPLWRTIWKFLKKLKIELPYFWKKMWYIYTMEYQPLNNEILQAINKNELILPFAATWMVLEIVIPSEVSQTKEKYFMESLLCGI